MVIKMTNKIKYFMFIATLFLIISLPFGFIDGWEVYCYILAGIGIELLLIIIAYGTFILGC